MKIKWHFVILGVYMAIQIFRLDQRPPHWFDEAHYLNTAFNISTHGKQWCDFYKYKYTLFFGSMPAMPWLLGLFIKIFGLSLYKARLFSALCSAGVLILSFLTAKKIRDEKFAVLTIIIIATSYIFFTVSREVMPQPLATLLLLGALYSTLNHRLYLGGFLSTLSFLTHPIGLGGILGCLIIAIMQKDDIKRFILSTLITVLPYAVFIFLNWEEYIHQTMVFATQSYRICEFNKMSIMRNILSELPSRYFGLEPIGGPMWTRIIWNFRHLNKIYCLLGVTTLLFLFGFIFCLFKKFNRAILIMASSIMFVLAIHPNKLDAYLYMAIPFFSMMLAHLLQSKRSLTFLLYIFLAVNIAYLGKMLTTDKIRDYGEFISDIKGHIPKGATILGPRYFWIGLHDEYNFIAIENLIYYMEEEGRYVEDFMRKDRIDYVLLTCHSFKAISDGPRFGEYRYEVGPFRDYLRTKPKIKDYLYENFYPKAPKEEAYYPTYGFNNVAEEYQKSLKIYKIAQDAAL